MHGLVVTSWMSWVLTAVFLTLTWPSVRRLALAEHAGPGRETRNGDAAELLLVVAMLAMVSPVGGPIPAAGWQALFLLTAVWSGRAWWRGRHDPACHTRGQCAHHAVSSMVMLVMVSAMPHTGAGHGPWLNMSTMDRPGGLLWPLIAVTAAAFFVFDAARSGMLVVLGAGPSAETSRAWCRGVMGLGMGYLLIAAL